MEVNISEKVGSLLQALILFILPLVILLAALATSFQNVWFYLLCITWFGCGVIFFGTLN